MRNTIAVKPVKSFVLIMFAGTALAACTPRTAQTSDTSQAQTSGTAAQTQQSTDAAASPSAAPSVSPLVGTWTRDGDTPKPDPKEPQFTQLTFTADGSLAATYVAAGGALAGVVGKAPKVQSEQDTYTTPDPNTLDIAEGSSQRAYQFRLSGTKLFLTPAGGGDAAVFTKSAGAS